MPFFYNKLYSQKDFVHFLINEAYIIKAQESLLFEGTYDESFYGISRFLQVTIILHQSYKSRVFYIKFLVNPQCLPAPSNFSFTWVMIFNRGKEELLTKIFRVKYLKLFKFVPNKLLTSPQFLKIGFIEVKFIYSKSYPYTLNFIPYMKFDKHIQLSNYHHNQCIDNFHHPKNFPHDPFQSIPSSTLDSSNH